MPVQIWPLPKITFAHFGPSLQSPVFWDLCASNTMESQCPKCNHTNEITFKVVGHGLKQMTINFECENCNLPGTMNVIFIPQQKKKSKEEMKVQIKTEYDSTNYIG